jgi:hypothetical protein
VPGGAGTGGRRSISSFVLFTGSFGLTARSVGLITKRPTGVKSLSGSNATF